MVKTLLFVSLAFCLAPDTADAADDVFATDARGAPKRAIFIPFERANADLAPGADHSPVTAPAPVDTIVEEKAGPPPAAAAGDPERFVPKPMSVKRVERHGGVEKLTLKNGDVVINVRSGADPDKALSSALGGPAESAEPPIQPVEDWAKIPATN